jgi:tetratricopeptide (TPR) repeat protein
MDAAADHLDLALLEWRAIGDPVAVSRVLNLAGWAASMAADFADAEQFLSEAVAGARVIGEPAQLALSLHSLGELRRLTGARDDARALLDESEAVARDAGWRNLLWWPTWSLAALAREDGDYDAARAHLDRAARLCPKLSRTARQADCLDEAALLWSAQGDHARAAAAVAVANVCRGTGAPPRAPVYEPDHWAMIERVRAALGDDDYAAAAERAIDLGGSGVLEWLRA